MKLEVFGRPQVLYPIESMHITEIYTRILVEPEDVDKVRNLDKVMIDNLLNEFH